LGNVIELERARALERPQERSAPLPRTASAPPGLARRTRPRRIIAVGGGKGGIGKTMVSSNLGIALARRGNRVLLVDADLGGANLHTCLGVAPPAHSLSDFVSRRIEHIEDVIVPTGIENVSLIAGAQDVLDAANPKYQQKLKLLRNLQMLDVDYLVLDLGAGTSFNVLDFFLIADHGVLVLLPEPTSVENAYRFVKAAFFRRLQYLEERLGISDLVEEALSSKEGVVRTPYEFVSKVRAQDAAVGERLERELRAFRVKLVVNQARTPGDQSVGQAVVSSWKKFFGLEMEFLGALHYDDEAWRAVRKRRPVLVECPGSEISAGILRIADRLVATEGRQVAP
jgi:flagellar biosynthesis protein FlhG